MRVATLGLILSLCWPVVAAAEQGGAAAPDQAVARAVAFLAREVPAWPVENRCFSCHNNGDAFRALHRAATGKNQPANAPPVPEKALVATAAWLGKPEGWEDNGGEVEFSDKRLATVQFAVALAQIDRTGKRQDDAARPLLVAGQLLVEQQAEDGSWSIDAAGSVGSPATYGTPLATVMARAVLHQADPQRFGGAIAKADDWLAKFQPQRVFDAAALLLWLTDGNVTALAKSQRDQRIADCVDLIRQGQGDNGGWGPFATSAAEPFDTAVVLLALHQLGPNGYRAAIARRAASDADSAAHPTAVDDWASMIERGRAYLAASQYEDGSWPETTRPAGGESYAQRMSTTAWATIALIETQSGAAKP